MHVFCGKKFIGKFPKSLFVFNYFPFNLVVLLSFRGKSIVLIEKENNFLARLVEHLRTYLEKRPKKRHAEY